MFGNRDRADFIEKITDFISTVAYSELITVADNIPCIRPMVYVNDALTIYMVSSRAAAKIEQIKQNPHVSVVIIKSFNTQEDTREVIINGLASIVEDEQERKKVFGLFEKRPRHYQEWTLSDDTDKYEVIRIDSSSLRYFDYSTGDGIPIVLDF